MNLHTLHRPDKHSAAREQVGALCRVAWGQEGSEPAACSGTAFSCSGRAVVAARIT